MRSARLKTITRFIVIVTPFVKVDQGLRGLLQPRRFPSLTYLFMNTVPLAEGVLLGLKVFVPSLAWIT